MHHTFIYVKMAKYLIILSTIVFGAIGSPFNGRILGGRDAPEGSFPYAVSLEQPDGWQFCTGSILDSMTILTARLCVRGSPSNVVVLAGTHKLNEGGERYNVSVIKTHSIYYDIALLKLTKPLEFSDKISPIDLGPENVGAGVASVASGWGDTITGSSNRLRYLNVTTISNDECRKYHGSLIRDGDICAMSKIGEGMCFGDAGAPLVANNKQIGIVSWGTPCAVGHPDVYTRVSYFIDWIKKNM